MTDVYQRTTCRMCGGENLEMVLELSSTPPGNNFLSLRELEVPEISYPLELFFCKDCCHVQLGHVVNPKILYQKDYLYVSGTSDEFVAYLKQYSQEAIEQYGLSKNSLVVDIGSNDGTCLRAFRDAGIHRVLGIDPAIKIAQMATLAGIETVGDFFSLNLGKELREKYGPAALITSHNACAHIDHLDDVFRGVEYWLADNGVFILEVGYLLDVYENAWFDTIYHEHLDFHTIAPFKTLFRRVGLEMIDVLRISPQGGSIRIVAQKIGGPRAVQNSVFNLIANEELRGLNNLETFKEFGARIDSVGEHLRKLIQEIKSSGKTIAAFGAPTKSTTLLAHFGLGRDHLDFIVDDNPLKQGLFAPASHIPVLHPEELHVRKPDFLLILAWNFAGPIMRNNQKYQDAGGKFIIPMPEPRIVS